MGQNLRHFLNFPAKAESEVKMPLSSLGQSTSTLTQGRVSLGLSSPSCRLYPLPFGSYKDSSNIPR